ncbi:YheC/YheD family protein [Evansella sp. LMS18]|jgi:glutathione synthase/RimK-type ligase-like ATP-grasp enzyme|uniref:YheC/YheD family protein n=1 Tax=Evansella sp. LMS18 TaxID=2924033 RepID=UPI0020D0DE3B|nr:YheC/YheD family protein [Evansella sp. LMS18]UTR10151.1 YheC/YheD family protein [Evansella sp. LMS18]
MLLKGRNKYDMYLAMKSNSQLASYLPETKPWSQDAFLSMLDKYKSIVVKPNNGSLGREIYFVDKKKTKYQIRVNKKRLFYKNIDDVCAYMEDAIKDNKFIIQKEVKLAKIDSRRFDFRIIVQRKTRKKPWQVTGIIARRGGKGYKVTNRSRRGEALHLDEVMKKLNITGQAKTALVEEIKKVSLEASQTLGKAFPKQRIFGVDIGMDQQGNLHIFELNRWPLLGGFRSLEDQSQYELIMKIKEKK